MNLELTDHRLSVLVKEKYLVGFAFLSEHHDYQDRETFHLNMRSSESFINIVRSLKMVFLPIRCSYMINDHEKESFCICILFPFHRNREPMSWNEFEERVNAASRPKQLEHVLFSSEEQNIRDIQSFHAQIKRYCEQFFPHAISLKSELYSLKSLRFISPEDTIMGAHARFASGELTMPSSAWVKVM